MAGLQSDDVVDSLAKSIKERSVIKDPTSDAFRKTGTKAAEIIAGAFKEQGVELATNISVLDFGAGSGRVALPLMAAYPAMALTAADVDSESIEYLSHKVSKHCQVLVSGYLPPLDVPGKQFDAAYAISVWSHFPEDLCFSWLEEMQRVTRPGAILLITVAGKCVLEQQKVKPWTDISIKDYENEKFVYREYANLHNNQKHYPGIAGKGSWGVTAIHRDYIFDEWSRLFQVIEVKPCAMNGQQDLVVLRRE